MLKEVRRIGSTNEVEIEECKTVTTVERKHINDLIAEFLAAEKRFEEERLRWESEQEKFKRIFSKIMDVGLDVPVEIKMKLGLEGKQTKKLEMFGRE